MDYCDPYHNGYGWDFNGASNTLRLNERIRDFTIRRLKSEVLTDLPPKTRTFLPVELNASERKKYQQSSLDWRREYSQYLGGGMPQGFVLNMLTDLRHVCGQIKVRTAVEWAVEYQYQTDKPLVIYSHHRDVAKGAIDGLIEQGLVVDSILGDTPSHKRGEIVEAFQSGETDVLVCSTIAAKEGITLTRADTVLFIEREWVPGWEEQAEDRVLRIGQESDKVHAIYLSCADTIDSHFNEIIEEKRKVVKSVLDGGDLEDRQNIVKALLNKMEQLEGFPPLDD
jgi:SNF2 family DNA or RNA helicase